MNKRKIRDWLRLGVAILFFPFICFISLRIMCVGKLLIDTDLNRLKEQAGFRYLPIWLALLDLLHYNKYYRNIFYHRLGPINHVLYLGTYRATSILS